MTKIFEDIKTLKDINMDLHIILKELAELESGENADYSNVIQELSWNRMILNNRLKSLREKNYKPNG